MAITKGFGEGLGSVFGGIAASLLSGEGGEEEYRRAVRAWEDLENANFDLTRLSPPQLRQVVEIFPELRTAAVPGAAPEITEGPEAARAQLRQLANLERVSQEGLPLVDRLAAIRAGEAVRGANKQALESALQNLAARGRLGGGTEMAARLAAQSTAANLAGDLGSDFAEQAALRRLGAAGQAAGLAGDIRAQELAKSSGQANVTQRFNELLYGLMNQAAEANAQRAMQAQAWNAQTAQRVAEQNPMLRYGAESENINRVNQLLSELWGQNYQRTRGLTGALGALGGEESRQQAGRAEGIYNIGRGGGMALDAALGIPKTETQTPAAIPPTNLNLFNFDPYRSPYQTTLPGYGG